MLTGGVENGFVENLPLNNIKLTNERLEYLKNIFHDNLYVELQRHGIDNQIIAEKILIELADKHEIPLVATNDCFPKMKSNLTPIKF